MAIKVKKRPYAQCFAGNPVYWQLYSSEAVTNTNNFFEVRVMFKPIGGDYAEVVKLEYSPSSGYADVDIKDIVDSMLEFGLIPFYTDEKTIWSTDKQAGYCYLEFREATTGNPNPSWDDTEKNYEIFVVKGGLNYFLYRGNNYWVNYFPAQKPFLTWQKNGRPAARSERMYLAWLNLTQSTTLKAVAKAFYTDGTVSAAQEIAMPDTVYGMIYYVPSGCDQWGLDGLNPAKTIHYWSVQITDDDGAQSEIFIYEADNIQDYNDTTLSYRNSVGGLDSVRIRGVIEETANYTYSEQETAVPVNYFDGASVKAQRRITDNAEQIIYKGDVGHLSKEEQDRLRDAFIQREVWWCINKKWWPVIVSTKTNKLRSTLDQRWSMPIEWELAYAGGEYYTPLSLADDLGDGVFTDNVCLATVSPITISVDLSDPVNAQATINGTELDPQNASIEFQFRILNEAGAVVTDWTTESYGNLPLVIDLAKDTTYTFEARGICATGIYGPVSSKVIDTNDVGGSGGGGGYVDPTPLPGTSKIVNTTSINAYFEIWYTDTSGPAIASGYVGANNETYINLPNLNPADKVYVYITNLSPASASLVSNGATYYGVIGGLSNPYDITFFDVYIISGATITLN